MVTRRTSKAPPLPGKAWGASSVRTAGALMGLALLCACAPQVPATAPTSEGTEEPEASSVDSPPASAAPRTSAKSDVALLHPASPFPWLGVELKATGDSEPGVMVRRVVPGSPAERALLEGGDIIIALDGTPMQSPTDVTTFLRNQRVDAALPVSVLRNGHAHLVRVELEGMPAFEDRLRLAFVGKKAPEINGVVTFQGEAASLAELEGQVVVLEFWASFCGVCRVMGPVLDGWHKKYQLQGAHVFGITPDPPSLGQEVARRANMTYTLASDVENDVIEQYYASQIPTLFVIDRHGVIRDAIVGYDELRLQQTQVLIEKLLNDPA